MGGALLSTMNNLTNSLSFFFPPCSRCLPSLAWPLNHARVASKHALVDRRALACKPLESIPRSVATLFLRKSFNSAALFSPLRQHRVVAAGFYQPQGVHIFFFLFVAVLLFWAGLVRDVCARGENAAPRGHEFESQRKLKETTTC